jgi:DNA-binding NarL/FixJ family response regulator
LIGGGWVEKRVRVLVVDDYEPWRRFFSTTLQKRPELQIIGEASDGLDAVHRAQQLQPDLILLDIGLPTLSGVEAARRIRELSPKSKILFASDDRSPYVAKEALSTGAVGYVVKMDSVRELLLAVETVLRGETFISASLRGHDFTSLVDSQFSHNLPREPASRLMTMPRKSSTIGRHEAEFYSDDLSFLDHLAQFVAVAVREGNAAIVIATEPHRDSLLRRLQAQGLDIWPPMEQGRYIALDAAEVISQFMLGDMPDPVRFLQLMRNLIETAARARKGRPARVAIFGECAPVLWADGNPEAAIQIENLANQLVNEYDIRILCGYSLLSLQGRMDTHVFKRICAEHSAAFST